MKLVTYLHIPTQSISWGLLKDHQVYSLKEKEKYSNLLDYIRYGNHEEINQLNQWNEQDISVEKIKILAPYKPIKNIFCVGKNYVDHALEMSGGDRSAVPEHPVFFTKAPTSIVGHLDSVESYPNLTSSLDYEGELLVVIGKTGRDIREEDALDYIFGYSILNDITARDIQKKHLQFFKGKSLDTHAPFGPCIVPKQYAPRYDQMSVRTYVNDELRQDGNTSNMIFSVPRLIHVLSQGMTLEAGDLIATGTPSGVGQGYNPPKYLKAGDHVRVHVEGIGEIINPII